MLRLTKVGWNMDYYEISLDDLVMAQTLAEQPGRTAYLDESGSFGFDFEQEGVTTHYVVCAVIVDNSKVQELELKVEELQRAYFGGKEMKSSAIGTNHVRRMKVLTELLLLDISLIMLIADKQAFRDNSPLKNYKGPFVKFLHQKLYDSMYCAYPKLKIVEDEYGTSEFQKGYRDYVCDHRPAENIFNEYDFDYVDSKNSGIVQIADILAGSVRQHIMDNRAPDVLKLFQGKIRDVVNFPEIYTPHEIKIENAKDYDLAVYNLAYKCARDYIESHKTDTDEEVRLKVLFLRLLLYKLHNYSKSKYIYAGEIVDELSSLSERRITKDYLYRRIIAKLRDDGVLIASSSHGYKIPTCVQDIQTYISQTETVVSPMLHRIGKCRTLIAKQTDGKLDILDAPALAGYKRYFGDY